MRWLPIPFVFATLPLQAQQTSVLFLGNSYTYVNDLPNTLRQLALSLGDTMTVASSAPGGYTLFQHSTYAPTLAAIGSQQWDFVVLQEQSQLGALPVEATNTELGAIQLMEDIEANYECTYPVFYMTWGRQNGDPQNCASFPFMCTYDGMQQGLRDNYVYLATMNDAYVSPVGVAWKQVRDTHPLINLYDADGSHPSPAGTYLAACVFYCTLFQESCVPSTYAAGLQADSAAILRSIASSVVLGDITEWNLDVPNGTSALLDGATVGPDWITLVHNGQGTHLWTCTNGQSFTTGTVTFNFSTSDTYLVTHTYNDPCGNTDTVTLTFNVVVGVAEHEAGSPYRVFAGPAGFLEVHGAVGGETLSVFDATGRMLSSETIGRGNTQVDCPSGMLLWTINDASGTVVSGKVLVH
ncbi:MAG: hypothetical protein KA941_11060 [Flavobacteriales bacterium]|nr:hypothetical protein [Flavobacteriales bacterium]